MELAGRVLLILAASVAAPARCLRFRQRISRDLSLRIGILVGVAFLIGTGLMWAGGGL